MLSVLIFFPVLSEWSGCRVVGRKGGPYEFNLRDIEKVAKLLDAHGESYRVHLQLEGGALHLHRHPLPPPPLLLLLLPPPPPPPQVLQMSCKQQRIIANRLASHLETLFTCLGSKNYLTKLLFANVFSKPYLAPLLECSTS